MTPIEAEHHDQIASPNTHETMRDGLRQYAPRRCAMRVPDADVDRITHCARLSASAGASSRVRRLMAARLRAATSNRALAAFTDLVRRALDPAQCDRPESNLMTVVTTCCGRCLDADAAAARSGAIGPARQACGPRRSIGRVGIDLADWSGGREGRRRRPDVDPMANDEATRRAFLNGRPLNCRQAGGMP